MVILTAEVYRLQETVTKLGFLFIYMLVKYWIEGHLVSRCFSSSFTNDPIAVVGAVPSILSIFVAIFGETHSLCRCLVIRKKPLLTG